MAEPISENQDSPDRRGESENKTDSAKQQVAPTVAKSELPITHGECGKSGKKKRDWYDYATGILELAGLAVLCVYAAYTIKIADANKKAADAATCAAKAASQNAQTAKDTLDEMRTEQRPWILAKEAKIKTMEPGKPVEVEIVFENFGHSPALNAKFMGTTTITNNLNLAFVLPPITEEVTPAIVVPTMEMHITVHTLAAPTPDEIEHMKKSDVRFYIFGKGTYLDTSAKHAVHHTEFCHYFTYGNFGLIPCVNKTFKNTAD